MMRRTRKTKEIFSLVVIALCLLLSHHPAVLALPPGFTEKTIINKDYMTDMVWMANKAMLVTLKEGIVNLHIPGNDYEYDQVTRVLDIRDIVCTETERGLGSIQLHPRFEENGWLYLYYTFPKHNNCDEENPDTGPVNRLSRWTFRRDTNTIEKEVVLLDTPSTRRAHHNSGKIEFGKDGLLYVSIGDLGMSYEAQEVNSLAGGIVRLTDVGEIPQDNPFAKDPQGVRCHVTGRGNGKCKELYALGLRNPWRFGMDPDSDKVRFFVNDVGGATWEEVSEGGKDWENATAWNWALGLQNFGWPVREGPCKRGKETLCNNYGGYIHPFHFYIHDGGGAATAGTFVAKGVWPSEYDRKWLYADFVFDKMYVLTHDKDPGCLDCNPAVSRNRVDEFLSASKIITMKFGPYQGGRQALYYTTGGSGGVMRQVVSTELPPPTAPPPTTPPAPTPFTRPDGQGGYPGVLFPWRTGSNCPSGFDYCGVLEFCMKQDSPDLKPTYGYRLPCFENDCKCRNGPGPLIRLKPGNLYRLTLRNAASEVTNLHAHGLHIVGDGSGDDVTRKVTGGSCLDYTWDIKADHPSGTFWYHAHHHGSTEKQVVGGAFGMLIVEENVARNPSLPNWALNERLLQVSVSPTTNKMIANGRRNEIFEIQAKQWYRIRVSIVHADAVPYNLEFDDQGMCDIHKVAADGIWRTRVPGPSSSVWELTGASRADFAVRCNVSQALVPVYYRNRERVANIWVREKMANPHVMTQWKPNRPYSLKDMSNVIVRKANKYAVRLGFDYVNSKSWNQMEPITTIAYNQIHEWTLLQTAKHPFHLHLYHMQIATSGGCGSHEEGEFYDTISAPGNCTVRFRTADIGQRCVLHCHVLFHSDSGSMSWVNVTGANMPVNNVRSFQYTCPDATSLSNRT